jgi:hypothetical protein
MEREDIPVPPEILYNMDEKFEKVYLSLENVPKEMVNDVVKQIAVLKKCPDPRNKEGDFGVEIIEPERVRVRQTDETKKQKRKDYLRIDYSKRPTVIAKKKAYNNRPDVQKKRKEKAKDPVYKKNKSIQRSINTCTYQTFKKRFPDIYKSLNEEATLKIKEKLEKEEQAKKEKEQKMEDASVTEEEFFDSDECSIESSVDSVNVKELI